VMPVRMQIPESRLAELAEYRKTKCKGFELQRFLCVWLRVERDMSPAGIAQTIGWHVNTVRFVQTNFIANGIDAFREKKRGGRKHQLMTVEEEKSFLETFVKAATDASLLVVREIKAAYEKIVGHTVNKTTIYRLLKRHKWRKVVPRPKHPNQNKKAVEAFKKGALEKGLREQKQKGCP